jgi:hypothetical protein
MRVHGSTLPREPAKPAPAQAGAMIPAYARTGSGQPLKCI